MINGLELDAWAEVVVQGANNPQRDPGAPGRVDASEGIPVLEVPTARVDRSMGDVHPAGNPHYTLDPGMAPVITANIVDGLARVAPQQSRRLRAEPRGVPRPARARRMARWAQTLAPFKGAKVVVDHDIWTYFLARFGLVQAAPVEERPGHPADARPSGRLIRQMKARAASRSILDRPWSDRSWPSAWRRRRGAGGRPRARRWAR